MANPEHLAKLKAGVEAWNAWRLENPGEMPDLIRANLTKANLSKADLSFADLSKANLSRARLEDADLSNANLSHATLILTTLSRTVIADANMGLARLGRTFFASINLSKTKGLSTCRHMAPSNVDIHTLEASGTLPDDFLRGCGVSDIFIEHLPSLLGQAFELYSCFISYSRQDEDFANRVHDSLQSSGVRCWFAPEDMKTGGKVRETIESEMRLRDKLVLILSESSIESEWVEHEVNRALAEEEQLGEPVLFPIRIDDAVMESEFGWAKAMREAHKPTGRHIGDFTKWKNHDAFHRSLVRLLQDLKHKGNEEASAQE